MRHIRRYDGLLLLTAFSLLGLAAPVAAQQPSQAQVGAIKQSCRGDYQSYCSSVPTGGSAALQCLQRHMGSLSQSCQSAVGAVGGSGSARQQGQAAPASRAPAGAAPPAMSMRQQAAVMRRSCGGDFRTYCGGVSPGGGRGLACLKANQSRLSPSCQSALVEARGPR